jgi:hypothetical protein
MRALLPVLDASHGANLYICGHDHDLELVGDETGTRPWFLVSGAGSALDAMRPRSSAEPPTIFPVPLNPFLVDRTGTERGVPFTMRRQAH